MFLRDCWYVAGFASEVTDAPFARMLLGTSIVMYRTPAGAVVALDNHCPHRFAPLDKGTLVGDAIQCPYHGLRFGPDGRCVHVPSGDTPPPRAHLVSYPVVERHALLWIWMGDAERSDAATIPDYAFLEDPACGWFDAYLHVNGNYQLIVDNLLDLSHAEFLHPLLASDGWQTRNKQKIEQGDCSIAILNIACEDPMLPLLRRIRPEMNPVGTWTQDQRWDAPSNMVLNFTFESDDQTLTLPNGHFVTPETATTSHYMIRGGHFDQSDNRDYTDQYKAGVIHVFASEDVPIIEAQQRFLGTAALLDRNPAILRGDNPAIRARRMLSKKIREEGQIEVNSVK